MTQIIFLVAQVYSKSLSKAICLYIVCSHSLASGFTQQTIAQLIGDTRYLRFDVLIQQDAKGLPFTYVNVNLRPVVEVRPSLEIWPPSLEDRSVDHITTHASILGSCLTIS